MHNAYATHSDTTSTRERAARAVAAVAIASLLAMVGWSCGGGSSAAPIPAADLPNTAATDICPLAQKCCTALGGTFDATACTNEVQQAFGTGGFVTPPTGATYSAQAAGDCVAAISADYAACPNSLLAASGVSGFPSACGSIYTGTTALGGGCTNSAECAPVSGGTVHCAGTCIVTKVVPVGASCGGAPVGNVINSCDSSAGDSCSGAIGPTAGTCVAPIPPDGVCSGAAIIGRNCMPGYACLNSAGTLNRTCQLIPDVGQPCTRACVKGAYCDNTTNKCVPTVGYGATCNNATGPYCGDALRCNGGKCAVSVGPPGCTVP